MGRRKHNSEKVVKENIDDYTIHPPTGDKCDECHDKAKHVCPKCGSLFCTKCLKANKYVCYSCDYKIGGKK